MNTVFNEEFLFDYLKNSKKPIYIYGMGNGAEKLKLLLEKYGITLSGIFASDDYARGNNFLGFKVGKYKDLPRDAIILLAFGSFIPQLLERFNNMAEEHEFFAPDMPLFGNDFFEPSHLQKYRQEIEKAYNSLADDLSKQVFINTVKYKISGKINYLREIETERSEIFKNLIKLNSSESFLDLGAYDGDTVDEFKTLTNNSYREIIAVEPDIKNFKKLSAKTTEALLLNIGVYNFNGTLSFSTEGNRNSSFKESGKNSIAVKTIDSICSDKDITFIKMDVEGSEREAIEGGSKTLKVHKPKLIISAYHKTFDFFTLINQIVEINPEYKIFLRHQPYIPNWETNIVAI